MHAFLLTLLVLPFPAAASPHTVTMEDFYRKQCETGDQAACEKLDALSEGLKHQEKLQQRSVEFWKNVDTRMLMLDEKRPDLYAAYPLVMRDYIATRQSEGSDEKLDEERLPQCARHYHNYWINKKLWYPSDDEGRPDWPSIYIFIVDHYYGYCLRSINAE